MVFSTSHRASTHTYPVCLLAESLRWLVLATASLQCPQTEVCTGRIYRGPFALLSFSEYWWQPDEQPVAWKNQQIKALNLGQTTPFSGAETVGWRMLLQEILYVLCTQSHCWTNFIIYLNIQTDLGENLQTLSPWDWHSQKGKIRERAN